MRLAPVLVVVSWVIYVTRSFGVIFEEYVVDQGRNLTLRCDSKHPVRWVREGRREDVRQFQSRPSVSIRGFAVTVFRERSDICPSPLGSTENFPAKPSCRPISGQR
uniref:Ig-like domain-containing protein n=1 Tax=Anopheles melas TaxID=34690 RepID=A0A182TS46_9DIPT